MNRYSYLIDFAVKSRDWDGFMARGNPPGKWFHYTEWDGRAYDYRTIAGNEIVIDIDSKKWDEVRENAVKFCKMFNEYEIPHILAYSGGWGVHIHVFIDAQDFERAIGWARIKSYLIRYFINLAGANPKIIDKSILLKSRQLIRDFGGKKFRYKTRLTRVPESRPSPKKPEYPDEIALWIVPVKLLQNIRFAVVNPDEIRIPPAYKLVEGYGLEYPPYEHARRYYGRTFL